jgi:hypothetical protein
MGRLALRLQPDLPHRVAVLEGARVLVTVNGWGYFWGYFLIQS